MMKFMRFIVVLAALNAAGWTPPTGEPNQNVSVSFQLFYDELSPHGIWVEYPKHGYVWMPSRIPGFSPYVTAGHWVLTEYGWTWVSDYPWGWATFHYGRWEYDEVYGWFWVPGNEWGPAWVVWRRAPGYYGWAPLRPGISVSIAVGGEYHDRDEAWVFVRDADIVKTDLTRHHLDRTKNAAIIKSSTVITNTQKDGKHNITYIAGPDRQDVQRVTKTPLKSVAVRENEKPGNKLNGDELRIYRPQITMRSDDGRHPVPSKVMKLSDVKSREAKPKLDQEKKKQGDKKEPGE